MDGGTPVWEVLQSNYPSVLTIVSGVPEMGVYAVDLSTLDSLL